MENRILVAGIGNIFLGDDAFGVEVVQRLRGCDLPRQVQATDFGIRGFDLAFALMDPWDSVILVDAMPRGGEPGTVYVVAPDFAADDTHAGAAKPSSESAERVDVSSAESRCGIETHSMHPMNVLRMVRQMGGHLPPTLLIACEPADLGDDEGRMGLSPPVEAAVNVAVGMIQEMLRDPVSLRRACEPVQDHQEARAS